MRKFTKLRKVLTSSMSAFFIFGNFLSRGGDKEVITNFLQYCKKCDECEKDGYQGGFGTLPNINEFLTSVKYLMEIPATNEEIEESNLRANNQLLVKAMKNCIEKNDRIDWNPNTESVYVVRGKSGQWYTVKTEKDKLPGRVTALVRKKDPTVPIAIECEGDGDCIECKVNECDIKTSNSETANLPPTQYLLKLYGGGLYLDCLEVKKSVLNTPDKINYDVTPSSDVIINVEKNNENGKCNYLKIGLIGGVTVVSVGGVIIGICVR